MDIAGGLGPPEDLIKNTNEKPFEILGIGLLVLAFVFFITFVFLLLYFSVKKTNKESTPKTKPNYNSKCPICGEPSETRLGEPRQDKLCPCHAAMLRDDQIALCKYCGSWYNTYETCKCRKLD